MKKQLLLGATLVCALNCLAGYNFTKLLSDGTTLESTLEADGTPIVTEKAAQEIIDARVSETITNAVDEVLTPATLEFHYDGTTLYATNTFTIPNWTVSPLTFVRDTEDEEVYISGVAVLQSMRPSRNYSVLIEQPEDELGYIALSFDEIAKECDIYSSPEFDDPEDSDVADIFEEKGMSIGWVIFTNDLPCVVTVREPQEDMVIIKREKYSVSNTSSAKIYGFDFY